MTKKLEEEFNLPPIEDLLPATVDNDDEDFDEDLSLDDVENSIVEYKGQLSVAERTDIALPTVEGLEQLDRDMDDYSAKALQTFDELVNLGNNVEDRHAAPIFDSASKMLQVALQAKQTKVDKKLKMIELQMRQRKLDQEEKKLEAYLKSKEKDDDNDNGGTVSEGRIIGDRAALLKEIMDKMKDNDK